MLSRLLRGHQIMLALTAYSAIVIIALGVVLLGVPEAMAEQIRDRPPLRVASPASEPMNIDVPEGSGVAEIVEQLVEAGVVEDGDAVRALLDYRGASLLVQAGRYRFAADTPPAEVARVLTIGPNAPQIITFRPGLRNEEIGDTLEREEIVSRDDWDAAIADAPSYPFLDLRPPEATLLGYLLPETFDFDDDTTAAEMLDVMLAAFDDVVTPELIAGMEAQGLTLHEVVTLASIVERESAAGERPEIAAVFRNRLDLGMPLQADPTVQFAVALDDPASVEEYSYWKSGLTEADLELDSPYNTYLYPGLPPGPIANPTAEAIESVVIPADVSYLYFVAHPDCDGTHLFASDLDGHIENVEVFNASDCAEGA
ncbi:MAG: endolytic transglycosylase MltG [Dehalococcoidia bacterium]